MTKQTEQFIRYRTFLGRLNLGLAYFYIFLFFLYFFSANIFIATLGLIIGIFGLLASCIWLGETISNYSISIYKSLLSPLMQDFKAKEENYKEIIRGLQKEIAGK